jgi:hypothetical protein
MKRVGMRLAVAFGLVAVVLAASALRAEPQEEGTTAASGEPPLETGVPDDTLVDFPTTLAKSATAAEPPLAEATPPFVAEICRTLSQAAADNDLPEGYFTRLIWQESRFDPGAVSPAGAQGIAQFMPATAAMRGLTNAFEPLQALRESASYLRELRTTFRGNLGLAAAAYNAGPGQVEAWLAKRSFLPAETWNYVLIVTGWTAEKWASASPPAYEAAATPKGQLCVEIAKLMAASTSHRPPLTSNPAWGPWGVQLAGAISEAGVLASYERLRRKYSAVLGDRLPLVIYWRRGAPVVVRVSEKSRADANALCFKLQLAGGNCLVFRNPQY